MIWQFYGDEVGESDDPDRDFAPDEIQDNQGQEASTMNGRDAIVDIALSFLGIQEGSAEHHALMDYYNAMTDGYDMSYWDAWCAAYVSACSLKAGTSNATGTSVNCDEFARIWREKGIYRESWETPAKGWLINYDWDYNGSCDHIGIVVDCDGSMIHVVEGNKNDSVDARWIGVRDSRISCFAAPDYGDVAASSASGIDGKSVEQLAQEVLAGVYGDGDSRRSMLGSRYAEVQAFVNKLCNSGAPAPVNTYSGSGSIREVQQWICDNYARIQVDGIFGSETKSGLTKALQTELNRQAGAELDIDGIFGNCTYEACINVSCGSHGNLTKTLQGCLICLGYNTNGFDGIFGNATYSSVRDYQERHGLAIDGIAGRDTFRSLLG